MATIGAAQGLKGEVRVNPLTSEPMALVGYRSFHRQHRPHASKSSAGGRRRMC